MTEERAGGPPGSNPELWLPFVESLRITGVSISVFAHAGHQSTISTSDEIAERIDELQFELGEGPHWDALRTGRPVLGLPDKRWPLFSTAVHDLGVGAVFALPMFLGAVTVGVVELYNRRAEDLDPEDLRTALRLTARVTGLAVQEALRTAGEETQTSLAAPAMRREVHQATGIIIHQLGVTATEAFLRLRAHAFSTGRAVQSVAHDVVGGTLDFRDIPD